MKLTDLFGRTLRVVAVGGSAGYEDVVVAEDTTTGEQFRVDLAYATGPLWVYLKVTPTA